MINDNIELDNNIHVIYMKDLDTQEIDKVKEFSKVMKVKLIVNINNLEKLSHFKASGLVTLSNVHLTLECPRNIYLLLDMSKITLNSVVKLVDSKDKIIRIELFLTSEIPERLIENNIKVLERINYITDDIRISSKNFEILYQAKTLFNELKKD